MMQKGPALYLNQTRGCTRVAAVNLHPTVNRACLGRQTGRFRHTVKAAASVQPFYNRIKEVEKITKLLSKTPASIIVIAGPSDTGKTALLEYILGKAQLDPKSSGQKQVFLRLDCRSGGSTDPVAFVQQLRKQNDSQGITVGNTKFFDELLNRVEKVDVLKMVVKLGGKAAQVPLNELIGLFNDWLDQYPGKPHPVVIIDEANLLRKWKDDEALETLLNWFVKITKQQRKCHVILSSSDTFLAEWLETKGVKTNQRMIVTVGDLTQEEVHGFLAGAGDWQGMVNYVDAPKDFSLPDTVLPAARETLGGNIGAWAAATIEAAAQYESGGKDLEGAWKAVLARRRADARISVKRAFFPIDAPVALGEPPAWTRQQWAATLQAIKDAEHHVVDYSSLCDKVGQSAVKSLINYNYIAVRYPSDVAKDLPAVVFEKGKAEGSSEKVVTAPDAAVLEYILSGDWEEMRLPGGAEVSSDSSLTSPAGAVSKQLEEVQKQIDDVEKQIKMINDDKVEKILAAKSSGWEGELAYWQQKEQQLVEKERQLREKEKLLQEKELVLLKRESAAR